MGSNTEKKQQTNVQNSYKNLSKEIKSDNTFAIAILEKLPFLKGNKNYFAF